MIRDTGTTGTGEFGPPANQIGTDRNCRTNDTTTTSTGVVAAAAATFGWRGRRNRRRFGTGTRRRRRRRGLLGRRTRFTRFIDEARTGQEIPAVATGDNVRSRRWIRLPRHSGWNSRGFGQRRSRFPGRIEFGAGRSIAKRNASATAAAGRSGRLFRFGVMVVTFGRHLIRQSC